MRTRIDADLQKKMNIKVEADAQGKMHARVVQGTMKWKLKTRKSVNGNRWGNSQT